MDCDALVIGSGFGGTLAAHELIHAGWRVLMIERGGWVSRGPQNWAPEAVGPLGPYYSTETPYRAIGGERPVIGSLQCVGGPSVFYGGVSLRFRAEDFHPAPEIVGSSGARWPFAYEDVEPQYARAEAIIGVAGPEPGSDPTEPFHTTPYPQGPGALSPTSRRLWEAARGLGLHPFRLPLAFNHARRAGRAPCAACPTCDGFACAIGAKNDLATAVIPDLIRRGLDLHAKTVAVRLAVEGKKVVGVECVGPTGGRVRYTARVVVLAAGALATPHLALASGIETLNPAGWTVGRHLMRHYNSVVMGVFPRRPDREGEFHKQVGIHDFYFGDSGRKGKLGGIQQLATPPPALVKAHLPRALGSVAAKGVPFVTGLLVLAEDQPQADNRVEIDPRTVDRFGLPQLQVTHRYSRRDHAAGRALVARAREILHRAGAWATCVQPIRTFSHAVGTLRMGDDPASSALDPHGRFRGLDNVYVADASAFPTSAAVNPSLTIAAHALRMAAHLTGRVERSQPVRIARAS